MELWLIGPIVIGVLLLPSVVACAVHCCGCANMDEAGAPLLAIRIA